MGTARARTLRLGPPIGRLLVLLATLAGLFAMHGLSDHGTTSHVLADHPVTGHGHVGAPVTDTLTGPVVGGQRPGPAGIAMGVCLAVLGIGLLLWLRRRGGFVPARRVRHRRTSAAPAPCSRSPDPPDLRRLSIQRC